MFGTDDLLGLPDLDYNDFTARGQESQDVNTFVGSDVEINWTATSPGDWSRRITAHSPGGEIPEPATVGLLGLAALAGYVFLRRRHAGPIA